jgi:preprotein translocase subunit SecG
MMYQLIILIHVFAAVFIVALVLVQQGKGATMGAAFGSGASQTVFGSRGSGSFLFRITVGLAVIFFATSLALNYLATQSYKQEKAMVIPFAPHDNVPSTSSGPASIPSTQLPVNELPGTRSPSVKEGPVKNKAEQVLPSDIPVRK